MKVGSTGITRRQALVALGVVGGAGLVAGAIEVIGGGDSPAVDHPSLSPEETKPQFAAPRTGDFTLQGRSNDKSVIVLGAGVSGLCCAYELGKAGYRVTIVEARERIGGRCVTLRSGDVVPDTRGVEQLCEFSDGRWFNPGPARIAQHHTTLSYCRELRVPIEVFINTNSDAFVATGRGEIRRRRAAQADLDGYVSELLTKAIASDVLDDELSRSERELLAQYLRDVGELGRSDRGYETKPGIGDEGGTIGEPDSLGTLLQLGLGERIRFERDFDQASPMFHPSGGMDALPRAFAAAIDADVRLGHSVIEAKSTSEGVEVGVATNAGATTVITADYGVCTLPPHIAARLTTDWPDPLLRALDEPLSVTTGKIGLEFRDRFWEQQGIYGGTSLAHPAIRTIWYPSNDYFDDGGVVVGAYPFGPPADHFSRLTHDGRVELAVQHGTEIHGDVYREGLRSSVSVDWATQPHNEAAWNQWRRFGVEYGTVLRGDGNWSFAGDWLSRSPGWQHGALESARFTITQLHELALQTD